MHAETGGGGGDGLSVVWVGCGDDGWSCDVGYEIVDSGGRCMYWESCGCRCRSGRNSRIGKIWRIVRSAGMTGIGSVVCLSSCS